MSEISATRDAGRPVAGYRRPGSDDAGWWGEFHLQLLGPDGEVLRDERHRNRLTTYGDEWATRRCVGTTPGIVTGMRLGTGSTAPSKSGAGAAIVTYVTGSSRALDAAASVAAVGTDVGWRANHVVTWPAGVATATGISEVVVTNAAITDTAGTAADTIARLLLSPVVNKGASDTLAYTWSLIHNGP